MKNKIKSKILAVILCISTVVGLTACGGNTGDAGAKKVINIGMMNAPSGFNPLESTDVAQNVASGLLFNPLVELDDDMEYKPMLADSIETKDNQTFTVKLNEKAKWTDGNAITADDVIFTVGLIANPKVPSTIASKFALLAGLDENGKNTTGAEEIEGIKKVDDHTVEFKTKKPVDMALFEDNIGTRLKTVPKHILKDIAPDKLYQSPLIINPTVTSGAFKLVTYAKDQYVQFAANKDYFMGTPKIDELYFKIMQGSNITVQLESGEIDMNHPSIGLIPFEDYDKVKGMSQISTESGGPQSTIQTLMINTKTITDVKVREAFSYAINRKMIAEDLLKGDGEEIELPYLSSSQFLNKDITTKSYDPEKAKALLKEAGWDANRVINFDVPTGNKVREKVADIIVDNLKNIGIKVNVQKYDFVTSLAKAKSHEFDIYIVGIPVYPTNPDLSTILQTGGSLNLSQYSSPEMDKLLTDGMNEIDSAKKKEIYNQVQELFIKDLPCPSVYVQNQLKAVNKRVTCGKPKDYGMFIDVYKWDVAE